MKIIMFFEERCRHSQIILSLKLDDDVGKLGREGDGTKCLRFLLIVHFKKLFKSSLKSCSCIIWCARTKY